MSTLILGAGVMGVTTAYYLQAAGEPVTVVERREGAALETSFANGGLVTYSMSDPWAAPGLPLKLLRWIGREDSPFLVRPRALPGLMRWGTAFLANCTRTRWRANADTVLRLARYSAESLAALTEELGLEYDRDEAGTLRVFRTARELEDAMVAVRMVAAMGVEHQVLDAAGVVGAEPALGPVGDALHGGVLFPGDDSGDVHRFTASLAEISARDGAEFRYGTEVLGFETGAGGAVTGVRTSVGRLEADRYVIALGSYSPRLARPLGIRLAVYPVKGYSLTLPIGGWNQPPRLPVVDDGQKLGVTPLGTRLRVAGTAEFAGFDLDRNPARGENLRRALARLYPQYPIPEALDLWAGLRPVTPDGPPILGATPVPNLYVNCGQGHLGWTMACGSARILRDVILGDRPEIDIAGMGLR